MQGGGTEIVMEKTKSTKKTENTEKVEALVKEIQNGNGNREKLRLRLEGVIESESKKHRGYIKAAGEDTGELLTLCWLGIEEAIKTFDSQKSDNFTAWARQNIHYYIMNSLKKGKRTVISLFEPAYDEDGLSVYDIAPDESAEDAFLNAETEMNKIYLKNAMKKLSPMQKEVIHLIYTKDFNVKEVSKKLKITPHKVRQIHLEGLSMLKSVMTGGKKEDF